MFPFLSVFLCKHELNYYFFLLWQAKMITLENFVPVKWDLASRKDESQPCQYETFYMLSQDILKTGITKLCDHPQPPATIHDHPQPAIILLPPPMTTHNHP